MEQHIISSIYKLDVIIEKNTFMNLKLLFILTLTFASSVIFSQTQKSKLKLSEANKNNRTMNLTDSDTTGLLMNEDEFWKLIDKSRIASANDYQEQINSLTTILFALDSSDIEKFDNTFTALLAVSYDWKLWGASYVINGGCSDDCFDYFRQYLIAHGRDKFYQTLKNPESCVTWIKSEEEVEWEGLQYCAIDAYKQKTGKEIPKTYSPEFSLKGEPFDEENLSKQYPKLAKKFMGYE